jgi:hypothetical protein
MATLTFSGVTLWNDATTGYGTVRAVGTAAGPVYQFDAIARGNGLVAKEVATDPGNVQVACQYILTDGEFSTLEGVIVGARDNVGSLAVPGQPSKNNFRMVSSTVFRGEPVTLDGSFRRLYQIVYTFQRTRT